jgi:hypothetical protein
MREVFDNQETAISSQLNRDVLATLCRLGLGHPKRRARVDLWKRLCLQQKDAKCRVGRKEIAKIAEIAKLAIETQPREVHRRGRRCHTRVAGMALCKAFRILIEGWGRGQVKIYRSFAHQLQRLFLAPDRSVHLRILHCRQ